MANLVRNFIKGRMNKSVDERLVPNGEYIDAQNIRMGSTEDSEIGAVENTKGNEQLTTLVYPPTGDALSDQATCIGSYADGAEETIYWFVHDPNFTAVGATGKLDLIVSYNTRTDNLRYHVVSIDDPTDPTNVRTTLNFDPQYLITGVDLVDDLLFFTDDYNPPRRINVTKAYPEPSASNVDSGLLEDDILVIKRPPSDAPEVVTQILDGDRNNYMEDRLICFAYRYEYEDGEYSATSQFTDPAFVSQDFDFTPESFLNEGMENLINSCEVTVRTGSALVKGIDILFKEMDDSIIRVIEKVDKATAALADNSDYTITFDKSKIFTILPESEILRLYDNVPRFAKAQTILGNRLVYGNYVEGYDLIDENDQPIKFGYQVFRTQELVSADDDVSGKPKRSLHSNRSYEIGIIYMDDYGRSSTVLVNFGNDVQFPCANSIFSNGIQVQIPAAMRAPYWATRYKFAIKADRDLYETIYSNIVEQFEGHSYFLLEGENAAKVEEGDRYIVKRDASGPTTGCSFATVLEKKAYAADDLGTGSVAGTYMKILPDFNAVVEGDNLFLGRQSAGTNGGSDQNTENGNAPGDFPVLVYNGFETNGTALNPSIPAGSRIRLEMNFVREGRGDASCETRTMEFVLDFVAQADHVHIFDWFDDAAEGVRDAIESQIGYSGDPDEAIPSNQTYGVTTTGANSYGMTGDAAVNQIRFYTDNTSTPSVISFVAFGAQKCSGGLGSGSSPNRRSRINATWTIVKANETFVFETEPTDALPDLWYEADESFPIVTDPDDVRRYRGNTQNQTATLPAIIDTSFFNCISYGNGVESYKIRDSVKGKPILLGNRVSTVSAQDYKEIRRFADLTYSGVYNDETNVNKLNEFNLGLLNFKPLDDRYGPVEKLFGRRTDILTLQEDKISYVLAGKNLLTDSTGESVVASVPEVLGTQVARVEDYGISNNPESFAEWGPHKFFTDAKRGAVIHLFGDGQKEQLEVISENGMRSWFRDEFIANFNTQKLGGYDPYMDEYVLASNEVLLPGETDCIECNTVQSFLLTSAGESYCVDLGNEVGNATVSYNVIEASGTDSAVITASYDGTDTDSGTIGDGSSGSFTIDKDEVDVTSANISISYTGTERFVVQVIVKCPTVTELSLRLITLSQPAAEQLTIHSQYQWSSGDFTSPLSSTAVRFIEGAAEPLVSSWVEIEDAQGSNLVPTDGSDITMIYNRIFPDNYTIRPEDRFHLLRTDTRYTESQITDIINDGDLITVTPSGAQPEYTGDFTMPSTGQYLYLVWNYTDVGPATYILDDYPNAAVAYSVRRLSSTYSGSALRVRRTVAPFDEQDIGFQSNGDLDTAAIIAFGGSDPLTVSAWYDQSSSTNNATQATAADQPPIYDGASVRTVNGKPAMGGSNSTLLSFTPVTSGADIYIASVQTSTSYGFPYGGSNNFFFYSSATTVRFRGFGADLNGTVGSRTGGTQEMFSVVRDGTSAELFFNSSSVATATGSSNPVLRDLFDGQNQQVGRYGGSLQEFIIWNQSETSNRTGIEGNINTYFSIY